MLGLVRRRLLAAPVRDVVQHGGGKSSVIEATGRSFQPYTRPMRCSVTRDACPVRCVVSLASK
jgi:hypothetical protein